MSGIIVHHNGLYNMYSTISGSFCYSGALTLEQLKQVVKSKQGDQALTRLAGRLERAHKYGHSGLGAGSSLTLEDFLRFNRAGENERCLSYQECIDRFLTVPLEHTDADVVHLLPCPFCGGPPDVIVWRCITNGYKIAVKCHECGSQGPPEYRSTDDKRPNIQALRLAAALKWNQQDQRNLEVYDLERCSWRRDDLWGFVDGWR